MSQQPLNLALISCHVMWREFSQLTAQSPHVFFPVYMRQGLHEEPDRLRRELQAEIDRLDGHFDAILIGYGLCSNGISGLHASSSRLVFMRGHDCITFLLGSRESYQEQFTGNSGTYWYSSGWIETGKVPGSKLYNDIFEEYRLKYDEETAEYLIDEVKRWINNYSRACYIHQPWIEKSADDLRDFTRQVAADCGWQYGEASGEIGLIRDFVNGPWDDERFLVLEPGLKVGPSNDKRIILAEPPGGTD